MAYFNKFRSTIGPGKVYGQLGCQFPKNMFFFVVLRKTSVARSGGAKSTKFGHK